MERIVWDALKVLQESLSQTTALVDLVNLVVQGKHFVRMHKMGQLESNKEKLPMRWSNSVVLGKFSLAFLSDQKLDGPVPDKISGTGTGTTRDHLYQSGPSPALVQTWTSTFIL